MQVYFPKEMTAADLLPRLAGKNVVVAGGLHKAIKGQSSLTWSKIIKADRSYNPGL